MILSVIRAYAANSSLYTLALEACIALDGRVDATLLLFHDRDFDPTSLVAIAQRAFVRVNVQPADPITPGQPWPIPQNRIWQDAARWIDSHRDTLRATGWLWWEADACPLRAGWLRALSDAHKKSRKLFSGVSCRRGAAFDTGESLIYMNGVGIYPMACVDALADCSALYCRTTPFDVAADHCVMRSFNDISHLIFHDKKPRGGTLGRTFDKETLFKLTASPSVFYHGCGDGSLHALVAGKEPPVRVTRLDSGGRNTFYHSGDLGDIIYALPTVRELGGGDIYLGPDNRTNMMTREKMSEARTRLIAPLLEAQSYIHTAVFSAEIDPSTLYDLNQMRLLLRSERLDMQRGFNLARCYLRAFGLALENDAPTWLQVDSPRAVAPVVIARSPRYHNDKFDWSRIMTAYRGNMVFVGTRDEHVVFEAQWGRVPYEPTTDLLDLARVIAGASLFVGNQSCHYAIAEGLKKRAILETCPAGSNTIFNRHDVLAKCDASTVLPALEGTSKRPARRRLDKSLIVAGPVDWFTGLGRLTCQIATGLSNHGIRVYLQPSSRDDRLPLPDKVRTLLAPGKGASSATSDTPRLLVSPLLDVPARLKIGDVLFSMWESTVYPSHITTAINQRASMVLVPSTWGATVFSANGVTAPLRVVPLSVDPAVYRRLDNRLDSKVTRFGAAGRLTHGGKRKGIEDVIDAFTRAFPKGDEPVTLSLKLFDDAYIPAFNDDRIYVNTSVMTDAQMCAWYNSLDCFVCASKGEGWGLHVQEALACGVKVIAPVFSGLADIVREGVYFDIVEASEGYQGHWCQPDIEHLVAIMREGKGWQCEKVIDVELMLYRIEETLS